ncbi:MAG TPA: hypothetical protein VMB53_07270 [Gaiellaceae bacterium]|nr:hypothetical protein [Gaiellaceae bacterium]
MAVVAAMFALPLCLAAGALAAGERSSFWGDQRFGLYYVYQGSISAQLNGTRATAIVSSLTPTSSACVGFASAMTNTGNGQQMQIGGLKCVQGNSVDGTCGQSGVAIVYVERRAYNFGSYTCYPHGTLSLGSSYLWTVDDSGSGNECTYSNGTPYECQQWYDTSANYAEEWGEGQPNCSTFGGYASFSSWQYWTLTWNGWQAAGPSASAYAGCWSLGAISNSSWTISH